MSMLSDILRDADIDLFDKQANDQNGAPENKQANTEGPNGGDINALANSFIQEVEAFKQSLTQGVAANVQDPNAQVDPNQPNQQQQQVEGSTSSATIQKPDGTIIKVGSLVKLAFLHGKTLFGEVR